MSGDLIALPVALIAIGYHYGITRDVRRTLHRVANALEELSEPEPREQYPDVEQGGHDGH